MGRQPRWRRVDLIPEVTYFKPEGIPSGRLQEVRLSVEEAEAIRLKDLERLEQEQCAKKMNISRTTFHRILVVARQKLANALLNGKAIRIEGGNFEMTARRFRCLNGHEWSVPFEAMISAPPESCPMCSTPDIMPLQPLGFGLGRRGWRKHRRGRHGW